MDDRCVRLYHGSNMAIEAPDVTRNTGFADLGRGFYLTDDHDVARRRALSRVRRAGGEPVVSVFELDAVCVPWVTWGTDLLGTSGVGPRGAFGLCFDASTAGVVAWARYIQACRVGHVAVPGLGNPSLVRAWIATEEVEMVCSGFVPAEDLAEFMDPAELVTQYCVLDQDLVGSALRFVRAEHVGMSL